MIPDPAKFWMRSPIRARPPGSLTLEAVEAAVAKVRGPVLQKARGTREDPFWLFVGEKVAPPGVRSGGLYQINGGPRDLARCWARVFVCPEVA